MMDTENHFNKKEPEKLGAINSMNLRNKPIKPLTKEKNRVTHSSAVLYGSDKKDFLFAVIENVYYVNFPLHSKFINQLTQPQMSEQPLPAWLAD